MATVTITIAEVDVVGWAANCQTIVAVEDDVVLERQVRSLGGEAYETDLIIDSLLRLELLNGLTITRARDQVGLNGLGAHETNNSRIKWEGLRGEAENPLSLTSQDAGVNQPTLLLEMAIIVLWWTRKFSEPLVLKLQATG